MRRALAALTLILAPYLAQAQTEQVRLVWDSPTGEGAEALIVIRDLQGRQIIVERGELTAGAQAQTLALPPLPRAAETVQAGIMEEGRVTLQSTIRPVSERAGGGLELWLRPALAVGLADLWLCEDGETLQITQAESGAMLERAGQAWSLLPDADDAALLRSGTDVAWQQSGNEALLSLDGLPPVTCQPSLFRPALPLHATARDGSWHFDLTAEEAILVLPDREDQIFPASTLTVEAARNGRVSLRVDTLALEIVADDCRLQARNIPYPLAARLVLQGERAMTAGCAGSPLQLIAGASWFVTSIFGHAPEAATGSPTPELTLQLSEGQISGRGTCNRYVGRARVVAGRVSFAELGTTRLACPLHKQNLELRFLDALEVTTGFELSADGLLILRAGHMPVLTARQR